MLVPPESEKRRLEEIEHENRQNEVISGLLDNFDKVTAEGDNVTIDDCIQAPTKIKICGKGVTQEKREGYNYFKNYSYNNESVSDAGITVTLKENGKILVNGTSTKDLWFEVVCDLKSGTTMQDTLIVELDTSKTYTALVKKVGTHDKNISVSMQHKIGATSGSISLTLNSAGNYKTLTESDGLYRAWIYVPAETTCDNVELEIMLLEGEYTLENAPVYEQYGQSPSSKYPSPLEYAEGNQTIEHVNKNLFNCEIDNKAIIGNASQQQGDLMNSTASNTSNFIYLKEGQNIIVNYKFDKLINNGNRGYAFYDKEKNVIRKKRNLLYDPASREIIITAEEECYVRFSYDKNCYDIQVEYGTKITDYIEHESETINLSNLPEMYSEDDCIVYLEADDEKAVDEEGWYVYNEFASFSNIVNRNSVSSFVAQGYYFMTSSIAGKMKKNAKIYSTHQENLNNVNVTTNEKWIQRNGNFISQLYSDANQQAIYINLNDTEFPTKDDVINWWNNLNATILYELETPKYKKITDEVLIKQLDELRKMISYKGQNNFIVTAENGQTANLKVTVYKNSIKIMKDEIDRLEMLVMNNIVAS